MQYVTWLAAWFFNLLLLLSKYIKLAVKPCKWLNHNKKSRGIHGQTVCPCAFERK